MRAVAAPGIVTDENGAPVPIDHLRAGELRIYVPAAPDRIPAGVAGDRFIFLPGFIYGRELPNFDTMQDEPQPLERVSLRMLNYQGPAQSNAGRAGLRFRPAGGAADVLVDGYANPAAVPGLFPVVEDGTTRALSARYAGHDVWPYGDTPLYAGFAQNYATGVATDTPLRIVGVYRAYGYGQLMAVGSPGTWVYPRTSSFLAIDPVILAMHANPADTLPAFAATRVPSSGPNVYWLASDAWDLERAFSLTSLERAHPEWSADMRDAIRHRRIEIGMTRDMVAWAIGYPSTTGTIAQMNKLNTWYYDDPTPTQSTVTFRNGRVSRYDQPGRLP